MNWVEILQVAGPIALGLAGILSGYGIARHQSKRAVQAEWRHRAYDVYGELIAAAQQTQTHLILYDRKPGAPHSFPSVAPPGAVLMQANAATAKCALMGDGQLAEAASKLSYAITTGFVIIELKGQVEDAHHAVIKVVDAQTEFAAAARRELRGRREGRRTKHVEDVTLWFPPSMGLPDISSSPMASAKKQDEKAPSTS